jgi:hypothetical protein
MLVGDFKDRHDEQARKEAYQDQVRRWVAEQTANAVYLNDHSQSPANAERQLGRPMSAAELERRLKRVNPNLHFEVNPYNTTKKAVYRILPNQKKVFICAYENGTMPEYSVFRVKEEEIVQPDFLFGRGHLDRKDLPAFEHKEDSENPLGKIEFDPTAEKPGFKKVQLPWGEAVRGWRTVTIRLVEAELATPTQIEKEFGSSNRAEWARHMGKQNISLPW